MVWESHREIHNVLKKHHPNAVRKARKIFLFKYPKLLLFIFLIVLSYYLFSRPFISGLIGYFNKLSLFGILISGALTSLGFAAPIGIGLLSRITPQNILIAALIGGIGATIADLLIFKTIKFSFMDEFKALEKTPAIKKIEKIVKKNKSVLIRHYLMYIFVGLTFVTPLPDEFGVSMLAGLTTIKPLKLAIIGFFLHTITIFGIFYFI
ncbi:MAG: hypothetical protein NTU63_03375 [Candidatus Pacearchaeota archaeon]|nr:hypothetical protein [Candidatus Pacearchaeota archaeon]